MAMIVLSTIKNNLTRFAPEVAIEVEERAEADMADKKPNVSGLPRTW
jgi:hypothetical protein